MNINLHYVADLFLVIQAARLKSPFPPETNLSDASDLISLSPEYVGCFLCRTLLSALCIHCRLIFLRTCPQHQREAELHSALIYLFIYSYFFFPSNRRCLLPPEQQTRGHVMTSLQLSQAPLTPKGGKLFM